MRTRFCIVLLSFSFSLLGCGDDDSGGEDVGTDASDDAMVDTNPAPDTNPGVDADPGSCTEGIPRTTVGGGVGDSFPGFELEDCAGGTVDFYDEASFCEAELTVVSFAAGWCGPCIIESSGLAQLDRDYRDRGVRIIQILLQKPDYSPADIPYCQGWVERFGLTNIEVIDPTDNLLRATAVGPDISLPLTIIIGKDGVVKSRQEGVVDETLPELRRAIDDALGMPTTTVGLGETCGGMFVCGSGAVCSDAMICVPDPALMAACDGATPVTLEPGVTTQMVTIAPGRGVIRATCGDTGGAEALLDLTVPEGSYDLIITTDTPTNQAVSGLDTVLYLRNECLESSGELCVDDIVPPTMAMPMGNLFTEISVPRISAGVHTLGVELYGGASSAAAVEVSIELRAL